MPEFHDSFDDLFCLTTLPRPLDLRKPLFGSVFPTRDHEYLLSVIVPVLLSVVAIELLHRIEIMISAINILALNPCKSISSHAKACSYQMGPSGVV
jgi:hypothetical protein